MPPDGIVISYIFDFLSAVIAAGFASGGGVNLCQGQFMAVLYRPKNNLWGLVKFHTGGKSPRTPKRSRTVENTVPTVKSG